ncbi:NUDIX hydrolase [Propionivibrio limicola]|uniref:NUDIX hydrolase n=1 Tax=Propionivibrio limicola TaxID=167645 RepID=UPI0012909CC6|nr:NUDIX hydrolase [Propionivibrio limicola]
MNYCTKCGAQVELRIPDGDNHLRHVCQRCGEIHYMNPKLVIGCIAEWNGEILLCRRAIEPRYGYWTLPAGFMENGESTTEAALRETLEEACAIVEIDDLFSLINVPHINQVHLFYRGQLKTPDFGAGEESLETLLFPEEGIPWKDLAFRTVSLCLRDYFSDRRRGRFSFHERSLTPTSSI